MAEYATLPEGFEIKTRSYSDLPAGFVIKSGKPGGLTAKDPSAGMEKPDLGLNVRPGGLGETEATLLSFLRPFHETSTFGLSSKIIPAFQGEGKTYADRVADYKNVSKAVEEAHPVASTLGNIAGFVKGPKNIGKYGGSFAPAAEFVSKLEQALVKKGTDLASKAPMLKKAIQSTVSPVASGAAFGAQTGITESVKENPVEGAKKGLETALATVVGVPAVKALAKGAGKAYKAVAYKMGGIGVGQGPSKAAFDAYVANPEKVISMAGKQPEIADKLANMAVSRTKMAESKQADELIKKMAPVKTDKVVASFEKMMSEKAMSPEETATLEHLGKWKKYLDDASTTALSIQPKAIGSTGPTGKMETINILRGNPETINKFKKSIQDVIDDKYGSDKASSYFQKLKSMAYEARQALVDASKINPETAEYESIMKTLSGKMQAFNKLNDLLGSDVGSKAATALSKIDNITNKGYANTRFVARLKDFDSKFNTNFLDEATYAKYAKELGPKGRPSFGPYWKTGGWALPTSMTAIPALAGGIGMSPAAAALGIPGAILASPRITATALRAGSKIGTSQPLVYKKTAQELADGRLQALKRKIEGE